MKQNMSKLDRIIRVIISLTFVAIYFFNVVTGPIGIILLAVAGVFTLTSILGFCPLYWPVGLNTKD